MVKIGDAGDVNNRAGNEVWSTTIYQNPSTGCGTCMVSDNHDQKNRSNDHRT